MTLVVEQQEYHHKLPKQQQQSTIKPHNKEFTLDYLDYNQREKILKHLKAGKKLRCHHRNCDSFINNIEFSTLYEYNIHCHTRHKGKPLHPELSLIQLLKLEPRGNPWEDNSCSITTVVKTKKDNNNNKKSNSYKKEIENGLDFLLSHFNQERLFPRFITTRKLNGKQIEVFSKQEALSHFEESNFIDCRVNAFPSYTKYKEIQRYSPDFIFIDLDRSNFKDDKSFENALSKTRRNIKEKLNGGYPTVNNSGNGYHVIQPIECPIILEQTEQFQKYKNNFPSLSQEFLRFAEDNLSNGKADPGHHPSFKSCLVRVPNSINGKCLLNNRDKRLSGNFKVKILQKWNGIRPLISREFIEDFRTYLEQKITDQENNYLKKNNYHNKNNNYNNNNNNSNINSLSYYEWIETKILANPFPDCRKIIVDLILAPYLINIKKMSYDDSYQKIREWLDKCNAIQKLDNYNNFVNYRIHSALKTAAKKNIGPMSLYKIKTDDKYSNNLYFLILQKERKKKEIKEEKEITNERIYFKLCL